SYHTASARDKRLGAFGVCVVALRRVHGCVSSENRFASSSFAQPKKRGGRGERKRRTSNVQRSTFNVQREQRKVGREVGVQFLCVDDGIAGEIFCDCENWKMGTARKRRAGDKRN